MTTYSQSRWMLKSTNDNMTRITGVSMRTTTPNCTQPVAHIANTDLKIPSKVV